jgi:hypothetical protein
MQRKGHTRLNPPNPFRSSKAKEIMATIRPLEMRPKIGITIIDLPHLQTLDGSTKSACIRTEREFQSVPSFAHSTKFK